MWKSNWKLISCVVIYARGADCSVQIHLSSSMRQNGCSGSFMCSWKSLDYKNKSWTQCRRWKQTDDEQFSMHHRRFPLALIAHAFIHLNDWHSENKRYNWRRNSISRKSGMQKKNFRGCREPFEIRFFSSVAIPPCHVCEFPARFNPIRTFSMASSSIECANTAQWNMWKKEKRIFAFSAHFPSSDVALFQWNSSDDSRIVFIVCTDDNAQGWVECAVNVRIELDVVAQCNLRTRVWWYIFPHFQIHHNFSFVCSQYKHHLQANTSQIIVCDWRRNERREEKKNEN